MLILTLLVMLLAPVATVLAQPALAQPAARSKNLEMYWIDVEGGAATGGRYGEPPVTKLR